MGQKLKSFPKGIFTAVLLGSALMGAIAQAPRFRVERVVADDKGLSSSSHSGNGFFKACARIFHAVVGDYEFSEQRARKYLPDAVKTHREAWLNRHEKTPQALFGISDADAVASLQQLRNTEGTYSWGSAVRNSTYFVPMLKGTAVVKKRAMRSNVNDGRVYAFYNNPRYEVLAFVLDRYLEIHLAPAAVMLDGSSSASLKARGSAISLRDAASDPRRLMDVSHTNLLDHLLGNGDRNFPGNLLISPADRLVAIDFDLSRAYLPAFGAGRPPDFFIENVLVDPKVRFAGRGPLPGIFAHGVVEKLSRLDRQTLLEIAERGGLKLSNDEINNILDSRTKILQAIREWEKTYGSENIVIRP